MKKKKQASWLNDQKNWKCCPLQKEGAENSCVCVNLPKDFLITISVLNRTWVTKPIMFVGREEKWSRVSTEKNAAIGIDQQKSASVWGQPVEK